ERHAVPEVDALFVRPAMNHGAAHRANVLLEHGTSVPSDYSCNATHDGVLRDSGTIDGPFAVRRMYQMTANAVVHNPVLSASVTSGEAVTNRMSPQGSSAAKPEWTAATPRRRHGSTLARPTSIKRAICTTAAAFTTVVPTRVTRTAPMSPNREMNTLMSAAM